MFVSPTKEQTTRFSTTRVGKVMRYSPLINKKFLHPELSDRVFHKQFLNGSEMLYTYGTDDPDRLRGPSSDRNMYDEVQDMLYDPVITVGNETMSESDYAYETYAGTPKTMENTIEYLWETSTQTEWAIKCDSCGKYSVLVDEKVIGKEGPVCVNCQKYLNPFKGVWIDLNPETKEEKELRIIRLKGFHVNQLMMPRNVPSAMKGRGGIEEERAWERWGRILKKHRDLPPSTFKNEVMGISDAVGTRLISKEELLALCSNREMNQFPSGDDLAGITIRVAGVDWSGGGTTGVSRTVLWIWGFRAQDQKLVMLYYKVYQGTNPVHAVGDIASICSGYQVNLVFGDAGEGHLANEELRKKLGAHRVHQIQYGAYKKALEWNGVDRYLGDRTMLLDNYFMLLKNKGAEFARESQMNLAITDILNEYEEVTTTGRKVWRHSPQKPDDCLHAGVFGWIAFKATQNDMRFYQ